MKERLVVVVIAVITIVGFATLASVIINLSFGKTLSLYNVLLAAVVCTPVISLVVGKNAFDFYREDLAPRKRWR